MGRGVSAEEAAEAWGLGRLRQATTVCTPDKTGRDFAVNMRSHLFFFSYFLSPNDAGMFDFFLYLVLPMSF